MLYLRCLLYLAGQIVSAVVVFLVALIAACISRPAKDRVILQWARFNIWTLGVLCGITFRVHGRENIPDEASIIVSNHQSAWETLALQLIFPTQSYLLKKSLLRIPIFGWGLAMTRPVAIDRERKIRALDSLIKQGAERLREGRWLVIFPEGTRQPPGYPGKFQVGGAMIAAKTGAPIVPVAHNAGVFWPKKSFIKYPGTIDLVIGEPIGSAGRKARELNAETEATIVENLSQLSSARI
ncbi:MAG: 1-acyl-sn-glycerol-3-phosphate acyltransferase [Gammaproteobacteria bacterium]|nr:1-acyl-sn-glycerol-3-phosphate acyltransferase [Gammaproteobacteria bacterium]MYD76096.1 1-acyl-sn-glycerol-3-phosphate acyltransferase [Gammaproteobacteria bacterium]MYJ51263.1 1-acyl-sn-glycerol-3-phosphate acyltransferase [Gammaproteobacteria bacterium]